MPDATRPPTHEGAPEPGELEELLAEMAELDPDQAETFRQVTLVMQDSTRRRAAAEQQAERARAGLVAAGAAILAALEPADVAAVVNAGLGPATAADVVDPPEACR